MFSRTVGIQKTQIEALEAEIDTAIADTANVTIHSTTQPTQASLIAAGANLGLKRYYWWDGVQIRGVFGMLKDWLLPLFSSRSQVPTGSTISKVFWYTDAKVIVHGSWFTTTTGSFSTYTQIVDWGMGLSELYGLGTTAELVAINYASGSSSTYDILYLVGNSLRLRTGSGSVTTIGDIGALTPRAGAIANDRTAFWRDSTNPNNVQRRTPAGAVSTIVTGFTDLYHMKWDETTQKLILFRRALPNDTTAYSVNPDGTSLTLLVPTGNYAAGGSTSYSGGSGTFSDYMGAEVHNGYLYVPVPGSRYMNTYRKYNILTGAYTEESFDFGDARSILEGAVTEAKSYMDAAAGFNGMKQAQYWGSQYYAYLFDRLINIQRSPSNASWLLTYETGAVSPLPGAQNQLAWAVLPDNGISLKLYPLTDLTYRNPDVYVVAEQVYDTAVKEMILEWDATALAAEYGTLVFSFDNGLITATETIRVQFGSDTGANYEYSFYRNVVSTISNTTAAGAAYLDLYGVNTGTALGGFYDLTVEGYSATTAAQTFGIQIEGFTAIAVTTTNVNSILGVGKWNKPSSTVFNSIRVFLSGATASFPTGSSIRLTAYRTNAGVQLP